MKTNSYILKGAINLSREEAYQVLNSEDVRMAPTLSKTNTLADVKKKQKEALIRESLDLAKIKKEREAKA